MPEHTHIHIMAFVHLYTPISGHRGHIYGTYCRRYVARCRCFRRRVQHRASNWACTPEHIHDYTSDVAKIPTQKNSRRSKVQTYPSQSHHVSLLSQVQMPTARTCTDRLPIETHMLPSEPRASPYPPLRVRNT